MSDHRDTLPDNGITALLSVMKRLRDRSNGCPWDRVQTFRTIAPFTIEEAYEVADAIEREDMAGLHDELGDLLLQVVFHAEMAREAGAFTFADVARGITEKMYRRHPHVFGDNTETDLAELNRAWESQKADEREVKAARDGNAIPSALDGVAHALPALMRAQKLQRRAARVGFDWPELKPVFEKVEEELAEIRHAHDGRADQDKILGEVGDLIFACVNVARHLGINAEEALRHCNEKFTRRFQHVEASISNTGRQLEEASLEEMDTFWEKAKDL